MKRRRNTREPYDSNHPLAAIVRAANKSQLAARLPPTTIRFNQCLNVRPSSPIMKALRGANVLLPPGRFCNLVSRVAEECLRSERKR